MTPCNQSALAISAKIPLLFRSGAHSALALAAFFIISSSLWLNSASPGSPASLCAMAALCLSLLYMAAAAAAAFSVRAYDIADEPGSFGALSADLRATPGVKAYRLDCRGAFSGLASRMLFSCFLPHGDLRGGTAVVATKAGLPEKSPDLDMLACLGWSAGLIVQYIAQHEFAHALRNLKTGALAYYADCAAEEAVADLYALIRLFASQDIREPAEQLAQSRRLAKGSDHDTSAALEFLAASGEFWDCGETCEQALQRAERIASAALGRALPADPSSAAPEPEPSVQ